MFTNYAGSTHSPVEHDAPNRTTMTPLKETYHGEKFPFSGTPPSLPPRLRGIKNARMDAKSAATASPPAAH